MKDIAETYLGIFETVKIKEKEMKEKPSKKYLQRLRLTLRSKLNNGNKTMAVNTWAVFVIRYGAGILYRKTQKFMTMHGALHPKSEINRVYLIREMGERELISYKGCKDGRKQLGIVCQVCLKCS